MLSLGAVAVAVLAAAGDPAVAAGGATSVRLLYVRDAGAEVCPAEPEVRAAVAARLGYDPFRAETGSTLLARISKGENGLIGSIELIDETGSSRGKRDLGTAGDACDEMAHAMTLSMSIAIDPERAALGDLPPTTPATPEAPAPEPSPAPPEPEAKAPSTDTLRPLPTALPATDEPAQPTQSRRTQLSAALAALGMAGVAPDFAYGGSLSLQGRRGSWSLALGGRLVRSPAEPVDSLTQLEVTLAAAELSGCLHHHVFEHCLLGLVGETSVDATGISRPGSDRGTFGALGLRLGFVAPVSGAFGLFARLEGLAVLAPIRPQVDNADVWTAPSVAASLAVGARARFW